MSPRIFVTASTRVTSWALAYFAGTAARRARIASTTATVNAIASHSGDRSPSRGFLSPPPQFPQWPEWLVVNLIEMVVGQDKKNITCGAYLAVVVGVYGITVMATDIRERPQ